MKNIYQTFKVVLRTAACYVSTIVLMAGGLQAQLPKVDIGLFQKNPTTLQVKARPDGNFDGVVSNIQFTLSWDASANVQLGTPVPVMPAFGVIPVVKSGPVATENGVSYQKFSGTGNMSMKALGMSWAGNSEVVIMEIPIIGGAGNIMSSLEISEDAKTTNNMFNGVFYAELNALDRTGIIYSGSNLPVEYVSFTATKYNEHDVMLDWVTGGEVNNDYFEVEKKRGNGKFSSIKKVEGAGTTTEEQRYNHLDQTGMANTNYYRLRQVDFDGTVSYSQVIEITFDLYHNDRFTVYPTPSKSHIFLQATGRVDADYRFTISDLDGKEIFHGVLPENAAEDRIKIDLSDYPSGTYYIRTNSPEGKSYLNRVIKVAK